MSKTFNIYEIFFAVLFLFSMFVGSIRLPIGPIRLDFIFSLFILFYIFIQKKTFSKRILTRLLPFTFFILYFLFYVFFIGESVQIRDVLYVIIPIYTIITYFVLSFILQKLNNKIIYKYIVFFIVVNFIVLLAQYTNIFNTNAIFKPYYELISLNNATSSKVEILAVRPFGLTGNPTYLTFIVYLLCKMSRHIKKSKLILLLSAITMLLSCSRMVLLFAILWEPFEFIVRKIKRIKNPEVLLKSIFTIISFIILIAGFALACIYFIPLLHQEIWNGFVEGWYFQSYSYTYREEMFDIIGKLGPQAILFGGKTYNTFKTMGIDYFDSEYVMRILQFGIIGVTMIYYPLFSYTKRHKYNLCSMFILAICLSFAITQFTITNYAFIFYIIFYMAFMDKIQKEAVFPYGVQNEKC